MSHAVQTADSLGSAIAALPGEPAKLARSWRHRCPIPLRYTIAFLLVCLAWVTTFALRESVEAPSFQTPFFVCAIVLSSWVGGFGPGVAATLLSIFAVKYALLNLSADFGFSTLEIPKFAVFFFTGAFISWLARRQRKDEEALLVAREGLEEKVRARTADLRETNDKLTGEVAERIRAEKELQRLNRVWRVRSACNRSVARSADERELLRRVCHAIVQTGDYRLAWAGYADGETISVIATAGEREGKELEPAWTGGCGGSLAQNAIRRGVPVPCHRQRPESQDLFANDWAEAYDVKAILALPLMPEGKAIGSLLIYSDEWDAFDEKETELLQQAANDVAQGIVLLRVREAQLNAEAALKKTESELTRVARVTTMGELTASIAHEINQPLAALVTNANACLRWLAGDTPNLEEARTTAQRIVRDGKRAAEVISRIRALLSKGLPSREQLCMNEVIEEILPLINGELRRRRATLQTEFATDLPDMEMDRVQIQQVLMNLIMNALDAMNEVSDRPHELHVRTRKDGADGLLVEVQDSGAGLLPEQMDRLFDAFYSTKTDGMGMGLSISRSIVESHGGRLWAGPNNDGPGATFKFSLPLVDPVTA